jgi:hypothetical protein
MMNDSFGCNRNGAQFNTLNPRFSQGKLLMLMLTTVNATSPVFTIENDRFTVNVVVSLCSNPARMDNPSITVIYD